MRRRSPARLGVVQSAALAMALLAGCGSSSADGGGGRGATTRGAVTGTVTVLAAASLKDAFTELGSRFERVQPGVKVRFSFAGSAELATSINGGAPADVFAAASTKTMATVVGAGNASGPTDFARNTMEIATPPDNPRQIATLADLAEPGVKVATCQAKVPCGAAAAALFHKAKLAVKPVTFEADVKATLAKVTSGEVDAGIVYVTDVRAAGRTVKGITIPPEQNVTTTYPITALKQAKNATTAAAFVAYVLSTDGQRVLAHAGFTRP